MPSLTRSEAETRSRLLTVRSYAVELDVTAARESERFGSTTTIRFDCHEPGRETFVEVRPARLVRVTLNGVPLDPTSLRDNRLPLPRLAAENELVVEAEMAYSHTGEGLHRSVDPADGETYLYAQTFLDDAQRVFACFDQPDLKAPFSVAVRAPEGWTVLTNGTDRPLATYFVTVVAGPYASLYRTHDGLRLGLHCRRSLATHLRREADELFTVTEQGFDHYHALFGRRYPFGDTYHQVFVPEFNAGAMENAGCVTFRDDLVFRSAVTDAARMDRAATVVHEMAHMWFGDLVTMRWWDDLWLSESFADYMAYRCLAEATRFRGIWTAVALDDERHAYVDDQRPSTHPVSADVTDAGRALTNFDGISYAKGCATLRQLAALLGEETFVRGLRSYFDEHAYANADLHDLLTALGTASGRDLSAWAEVWLREAGVNLLRVRTKTTARRYETVAVEQEAPARHPVLRPHLLGLGLYDRDGDVVVRRDTVSVEIDGDVTSVPTLEGVRRADLVVPNDLDLAYARIRFDDDSFARLPELLPRVADSLTRALAWSALDDMVRSAEWPALSYVELAARAVRTEEDVAIVETLLRNGRYVADLFALPDERPRCLAALTDATMALLDAAPPGGDLQLAAARGLASTAGPGEAPLLRAWLRGRSLPPGLPMDTDLRWELLRRLVVLGLAGVDEIEDERAADRTAEGVEHAARCLAARPDPAAKQAAWQLVMADTEASNHILEETAAGFWQPEQAEITAPYVERYFDEIPRLADTRTPWMVLSCSARLYPIHAVERSTLDRAESLLRRDDLDPLLRRRVVDHTDTLRRALRAREETARRRADHRPTAPDRR